MRGGMVRMPGESALCWCACNKPQTSSGPKLALAGWHSARGQSLISLGPSVSSMLNLCQSVKIQSGGSGPPMMYPPISSDGGKNQKFILKSIKKFIMKEFGIIVAIVIINPRQRVTYHTIIERNMWERKCHQILKKVLLNTVVKKMAVKIDFSKRQEPTRSQQEPTRSQEIMVSLHVTNVPIKLI